MPWPRPSPRPCASCTPPPSWPRRAEAPPAHLGHLALDRRHHHRPETDQRPVTSPDQQATRPWDRRRNPGACGTATLRPASRAVATRRPKSRSNKGRCSGRRRPAAVTVNHQGKVPGRSNPSSRLSEKRSRTDRIHDRRRGAGCVAVVDAFPAALRTLSCSGDLYQPHCNLRVRGIVSMVTTEGLPAAWRTGRCSMEPLNDTILLSADICLSGRSLIRALVTDSERR